MEERIREILEKYYPVPDDWMCEVHYSQKQAECAKRIAALISQGCDKTYGVRIRDGWMDAGKEGVAVGEVMHRQLWTVVIWPDDDEPDLHKSAGLRRVDTPAPPSNADTEKE